MLNFSKANQQLDVYDLLIYSIDYGEVFMDLFRTLDSVSHFIVFLKKKISAYTSTLKVLKTLPGEISNNLLS